ncbi:uncharacterized protein EV420DRAFT_1489357 [Desarmillaria tabescens]|uniref:Uncharacterized protein n=1 Tax=Armillaria tabescens TaxID=1929756 RepID=A0AA39MGQ5_ARMTA|nr:uncharacterized protein EV420DRAFT_1489357 [Desarmillaria tabescens]KAK0433218.1 hypothetical protein EV420DRAFT_1489357 [Desarmillaria tabescens]
MASLIWFTLFRTFMGKQHGAVCNWLFYYFKAKGMAGNVITQALFGRETSDTLSSTLETTKMACLEVHKGAGEWSDNVGIINSDEGRTFPLGTFAVSHIVYLLAHPHKPSIRSTLAIAMTKKGKRMALPMPAAHRVKLQASGLKAAMKSSQADSEATSKVWTKQRRVDHEAEIPWTDSQATYIEETIKPEVICLFKTLDENGDLVHAGIDVFQDENYEATGAYRELRILQMKKKIDNLTTYLRARVASSIAVSATVLKLKPNLDKIIRSFMDFTKPTTAKQIFKGEHKAEISRRVVALVAAAKKEFPEDGSHDEEGDEEGIGNGVKGVKVQAEDLPSDDVDEAHDEAEYDPSTTHSESDDDSDDENSAYTFCTADITRVCDGNFNLGTAYQVVLSCVWKELDEEERARIIAKAKSQMVHHDKNCKDFPYLLRDMMDRLAAIDGQVGGTEIVVLYALRNPGNAAPFQAGHLYAHANPSSMRHFHDADFKNESIKSFNDLADLWSQWGGSMLINTAQLSQGLLFQAYHGIGDVWLEELFYWESVVESPDKYYDTEKFVFPNGGFHSPFGLKTGQLYELAGYLKGLLEPFTFWRKPEISSGSEDLQVSSHLNSPPPPSRLTMPDLPLVNSHPMTSIPPPSHSATPIEPSLPSRPTTPDLPLVNSHPATPVPPPSCPAMPVKPVLPSRLRTPDPPPEGQHPTMPLRNAKKGGAKGKGRKAVLKSQLLAVEGGGMQTWKRKVTAQAEDAPLAKRTRADGELQSSKTIIIKGTNVKESASVKVEITWGGDD